MSHIWNHSSKSGTNYRLGTVNPLKCPGSALTCLYFIFSSIRKDVKFLNRGQLTKNMPKSFPY